MARPNCTSVCGIIGRHEFDNSFESEPIMRRLESIGIRFEKKVKSRIRDFFLLGQGMVTESIPQAAETLLKRDYPQIDEFSGDEKLEPIFVPEGYVPNNPYIIKTEDMEFIEEQFPYETKRIVGDLAEKEAYFVLRKYFQQKDEVVIVIHRLEMHLLAKKFRKQPNDNCEMDFIIVNFTHSYIMNLEVKNLLGTKKYKKGLSSMEVVSQQIKKCQNCLEDWFSVDLEGSWHFIGAIFCLKLEQNLTFCNVCQPYIIVGEDELFEKMDALSLECQNQRRSCIFNNSPETLKTLACCLFYCCPVVELPLKGSHASLVQKSLEKSGSIDNIKLWCFPTPQQRLILNHDKLIFSAPWGSGKTMLMIAKAIELAKLGRKVCFLIFNVGIISCDKKTLLSFEIKEKLKDYETIKVESIPFYNGHDHCFQDITFGYDSLIIDEFFDDFNQLSYHSQSEILELLASKEFVWLAISNTYFGALVKQCDNPDDLIKSWFPDFKLAKMNIPLRMPLEVSKSLKSNYSFQKEIAQIELNTKLFAEADLPTNLAEGPKIHEYGKECIQPLPNLLQQAFNDMKKDEFALIVINDFASYNDDLIKHYMKVPTHKQRQRLKNYLQNETLRYRDWMKSYIGKDSDECQCKSIINVLTIELAMEAIGRPPPIYHCVHHSDEEEIIKDWINGRRLQDLVTSSRLVRGFEHDLIINIAGFSDISSRTSCQLFRIFCNPFLEMSTVLTNFLVLLHDCKTVMVRGKRPQFEFSEATISKTIGK